MRQQLNPKILNQTLKPYLQSKVNFMNKSDITSNLKLEKQLCFRLYNLNKKMNRLYSPVLKELSLTYPQYLVMLVLWDSPDPVSIKRVGIQLDLDTGTLSPLLKRMEIQGLINRCRNLNDERSVEIQLTQKGINLKEKAQGIPEKMFCLTGFTPEQLKRFNQQLDLLLENIS